MERLEGKDEQKKWNGWKDKDNIVEMEKEIALSNDDDLNL